MINVDYNDLVSTFIMGGKLIGDFSNRPKKFKKCLCRYFGCSFHSSGNPFSERSIITHEWDETIVWDSKHGLHEATPAKVVI